MVEGDISAGNGRWWRWGPQQETGDGGGGRLSRKRGDGGDSFLGTLICSRLSLRERMGSDEGDSEVHMRFIHRRFDLRCPADLSCF